MSDELERMRGAFRHQKSVRPDAAARQTALRAAMDAFQKDNSEVRQGTGIGARLRERSMNLLTALKRKPMMNFAHLNLRYTLAGGVSLAVLAFVVVNVEQIEHALIDTASEYEIDEARFPAAREKVAAVPAAEPAAKPAPTPEHAPTLEPELAPEPEPEIQGLADQSAPSPAASKPKASQEALARGAPPPSTVGPATGQAVIEERVQRFVFTPQQAPSQGIRKSNEVVIPQYQDQGRDSFSNIVPNPLKLVTQYPVSTFSVDVDTASYAFVRGALNRGVLPQKDAVRVEELINYFDYNYQASDSREEPFKANVSIMPSPWNLDRKLLRIGIKGYELPKTEAPRANLVFLIDTSGSMNAPDKLPLLRNSFKLLLSSLKPDDTVAIVAYAGSAGTVLEPTQAADKNKILAALDRLSAGGSTAGAEGIRQAYQLAERQLDESGVNRVILATDGDFNVGISDPDELKSFVERKRKTGVTLSVLGFGHGNYNDELMQTLAQNGNGNAAYIDTLSEARKVLVEEAGSTLFTIAKDVKLQLEFNPAMVSEYRLIGYETRMLNREDFNNDKVDAGDIGAGHRVTALYEVTPTGSSAQQVDDLRYQSDRAETETDQSDEYGFLKIRYKLPDSDSSTLISTAITKDAEVSSIAQAPQSTRFAAAVAGFGQILRGGRYTGDFSHDDVIALALSAKGEDPFGYRAEFINLVRLAKSAAAIEPQRQ
ncbi:vWA domain-containing protein [Denitrobaculum tricleocarpae]|uniref:VWA domain-containing protein n=1 Tax=Denitrobaculum tricleocarpae TaxID=2591009 RepID=A0A545U123_9PROT|nr:VWA domain-containing protein [Denitrobaculum tricleocarpae]TQV83179.1 VWA domain-containing protein [Denitrobaculum tricleocarpae]